MGISIANYRGNSSEQVNLGENSHYTSPRNKHGRMKTKTEDRRPRTQIKEYADILAPAVVDILCYLYFLPGMQSTVSMETGRRPTCDISYVQPGPTDWVT